MKTITYEYIAPLAHPVLPAETMNRKDLYTHLQDYHGDYVGYGTRTTSKSSKEQMLQIHENLHNQIDYTQASRNQQNVTHEGHTYLTWVDNPATPAEGDKQFCARGTYVHEHVDAPGSTTTEQDREILEQVQAGELGRVLSVTERKALERLIDNDFAGLKNEIHAFAKEALDERLKQVEKDFAEKQKEADKVAKAAIKTAKDSYEKIVKHMESAKEAGIALTLPNSAFTFNEHNVKAEVVGRIEAERAVRAENQSDLQAALYTLERQRLASQRLVLLAGISPEGQKLLDTIPSAKALMIEAAQERAARQIEG